MRKTGLLAVILGSALACSSSRGERACVPGLQQACPCLAQGAGIQVCTDDGTRFGPCLCPAMADAGDPPDASVRPEPVTCSACAAGCCRPDGGCATGGSDEYCGNAGTVCQSCPLGGPDFLCRGLTLASGGIDYQCLVPKLDGAPCTDGAECSSGTCSGQGFCVYPCAATGYQCGGGTTCCDQTDDCGSDGACCVPRLGVTSNPVFCCPATTAQPLPAGGFKCTSP